MKITDLIRHVQLRSTGWSLIVHKELTLPPETHAIMIPLEYADPAGYIKLQVTLRNSHQYTTEVVLGWLMQGYNWAEYKLGPGEALTAKPVLRGLLDEKMGYLLPVNFSAACYVEIWAM